MRTRMAGVLAGVFVALLAFLVPQSAGACEKCFTFLDDESCKDVVEGESGFTTCTMPEEASCCCKVSGDICTGGSGGSGGTGGTGGGGTNQCETSGFCPSECFSCTGGGGRPRV